MTSAFSSPIRSYCSARWAAARRTSPARSGWLEMLGIRRKSSSSLSPWSRVSSRNSSGAITTGYWNTSPSPAGGGGRGGLVDKAQQIESGCGLDCPVIDPAPAAVVHLRHGEGPVAVDGLHIRHVSDRGRPANALHHDGAHHRHLALGKAELLRVVPPLPGVAGPWDVALVRHPPRAIAVRELAARAGDRGVAVGDGVIRHQRAEAPRDALDGVAGLDGVVSDVAPDRCVHAGGAHLHDEATLAQDHVVDVRGPH